MKEEFARYNQIDRYLLNEMSAEERLGFEANVAEDPELATDVEIGREIQAIIRFSRKTRQKQSLQKVDPEEAEEPHMRGQVRRQNRKEEISEKPRTRRGSRRILLYVSLVINVVLSSIFVFRPTTVTFSDLNGLANAFDSLENSFVRLESLLHLSRRQLALDAQQLVDQVLESQREQDTVHREESDFIEDDHNNVFPKPNGSQNRKYKEVFINSNANLEDCGLWCGLSVVSVRNKIHQQIESLAVDTNDHRKKRDGYEKLLSLDDTALMERINKDCCR